MCTPNNAHMMFNIMFDLRISKLETACSEPSNSGKQVMACFVGGTTVMEQHCGGRDRRGASIYLRKERYVNNQNYQYLVER